MAESDRDARRSRSLFVCISSDSADHFFSPASFGGFCSTSRNLIRAAAAGVGADGHLLALLLGLLLHPRTYCGPDSCLGGSSPRRVWTGGSSPSRTTPRFHAAKIRSPALPFTKGDHGNQLSHGGFGTSSL